MTTEDHNTTQSQRGTEGYRAPELLVPDHKTFNTKTDIWSLGCILHDLCVGRRGFQTDLAAWNYSLKMEKLAIEFPGSFAGAPEFVFATWIRQMIDWDSTRRPTPEALGKEFWRLLYLVIDPSLVSATLRNTWANTDLLLTENLLSTDSPSDNLAMMKQIPPRWEHVLFQGDPHWHNIETLERAKQVAVAREKLLGESHPKSIHSKVRFAWTCFYMPTSLANSSEQFKKLLELKAPNENADRETVSYLAGIGWSEFISENYDESAKKFEKALEIQNQRDRLVDPDSLSYTVALAKVHLVQALISTRTTGRKRKRTSTDSDVVSPGSLVERALSQLHLSYNCQRFSPELGKNHPETAETMATLAYGYKVLAKIRKGELVPTKVLKQYYQSAEIFLNEACEATHMSLGDDHPRTLLSLYEVAHVDFMNGRTAEAIPKLEKVLVKQKYTLGIHDPDTQATLSTLRDAYRACGERRKLKDLASQVRLNGVEGRMLRVRDLDNGTDNEVDSQEFDQLSSQAEASQSEASLLEMVTTLENIDEAQLDEQFPFSISEVSDEGVIARYIFEFPLAVAELILESELLLSKLISGLEDEYIFEAGYDIVPHGCTLGAPEESRCFQGNN